MEANCPICNAPFSTVQMVLADRETNFQCRRCWTSVHRVAPAGTHVTRTRKSAVPRRTPTHEAKRRAA